MGDWLGATIGAVHDSRMYEKQRKDNKDITNSQREFDTKMANSVHQREVKDLQKAGLNPILSAGGNGAPSPTSAAPSAPSAPSMGDMNILGYGLDLQRMEIEQERLGLDKATTAAGISKTLSDTELNRAKKILAQKGMLKAELEGEASTVMQNIIKWMKKSIQQNQQPKNMIEPQSSGGELIQP